MPSTRTSVNVIIEANEIDVREFPRSGESLKWTHACAEITSDVRGIQNVKLNNKLLDDKVKIFLNTD